MLWAETIADIASSLGKGVLEWAADCPGNIAPWREGYLWAGPRSSQRSKESIEVTVTGPPFWSQLCPFNLSGLGQVIPLF